jgi:hypothetical protein
MKASIDLTNQAIDMMLKNDALNERVITPLKKKLFPFVACVGLFNMILLVLLIYIASNLPGSLQNNVALT